MDMFNMAPPPHMAGLSEFASLAILFNVKGGVAAKVADLKKYHDEAVKAAGMYAKLRKEYNANVVSLDEDNATLSKDQKDYVKRAADLDEAKRAFEHYKLGALDEIELERANAMADLTSAGEATDSAESIMAKAREMAARVSTMNQELIKDKEMWERKVRKASEALE